jgi:hypothetical protein
MAELFPARAGLRRQRTEPRSRAGEIEREYEDVQACIAHGTEIARERYVPVHLDSEA